MSSNILNLNYKSKNEKENIKESQNNSINKIQVDSNNEIIKRAYKGRSK